MGENVYMGLVTFRTKTNNLDSYHLFFTNAKNHFHLIRTKVNLLIGDEGVVTTVVGLPWEAIRCQLLVESIVLPPSLLALLPQLF